MDGFSGGLPLDEYNRSTPPGWKPGLARYPLSLFEDKLKLWYKQFTGADEEVGILLAGRLKEGALTIALKLRVPRRLDDPAGQSPYVGDQALCRPAVIEGRSGL